ncbi:MAG: YraN family protein [Ilumatobacteraceae bacterium]
MGLGHVPQEPVRAEGAGADVQGRQRRGAAPGRASTPRGAANQARGRWAEGEVARWYERRGGVVVDRNWRCPHGELDLVVHLAGTVVFCEVKARRDDAFGGGLAAVGPAKQRRLRRLAVAWLSATGTRGVDIRFDVAAVTGTTIDVVEAAF